MTMLINHHQQQWDFLRKKFEINQLSHAYLFAGEEDLGKNSFANEFIKYINCQNILGRSATDSSPANEWGGDKCPNCQMINRKGFPDFLLVESENGKEIPILKIRQVQNFLSYKPYYSSSYKSVIINNAEKMNQEAQSCFLKTLEEPKGKTLLILLSSRPGMLLPTIFSRCQTIKFWGKPILSQPKIEEEKKLLQDLLRVVGSGFSEKFKYVKSLDLEQQKIGDILKAFQKYLRYLLFLKIGAGQLQDKYFSAADSVFKDYSPSKIKEIINLTEDINNKIVFTNANQKLALEILLMEI